MPTVLRDSIVRAALATGICIIVPGLTHAQGRPTAAVDLTSDTIPRITIAESISIDSPVQFVSRDVFVVPDGHRLLVDYVSLNLDAVLLGAQPGQPVKAVLGPFVLGIMEGIDQTTRGAPQRFIGRQVPVSFGPGQNVRVTVSPQLSSVNLDFGSLQVAIAGRLVREP